MTVSVKEIQRIADLAAISLEETDVTALSLQLEEILEFVAQLQVVSEGRRAAAFRPGPQAAPLREDAVSPIRMFDGVETFAPDTRDGFILVPKLETLGDE